MDRDSPNSFEDVHVIDKDANELACEYARKKIKSKVEDPKVAELLLPQDYPIGTKRLIAETNYYETYNRDNVTLVDVKSSPIEAFTDKGIKTSSLEYDLDVIICATGFDAMTGSFLKINPIGKNGMSLSEKWKDGAKTTVGMMVNNFPNMFIMYGPGSSSVFCSLGQQAQQQGDWIKDLINYMRDNNIKEMEPSIETEKEWVDHVNQIANMTLFVKAKSWYMGANIPGKPQMFMPYIGGAHNYSLKCNEIAESNYSGFIKTPH
ncbi:hypothetical protein [Maribacter sp. 4G9]|uniref:hypothetical protein n=1 Tax=Maribacter sp. 4G9 TaxID=1889777 RepID=UPI000C15D8D6|nr:hypothetical protein [Maribacter sp. 4G9]PIB27678.1 hypothetical protein BFP75_07085 [Maribacter sp. 4G9]